MHGGSLGTVEFGRVLHFAVGDRNGAGAAHGWTPSHYDVINPADQSVVLGDVALGTMAGRSLYFGSIDTRDTSTDATGPFEPGQTYTVLIKEDTTDNPTNQAVYNFTVLPALEEKLTRLLALEGENLLVDGFEYDDGNNVTAFRVRLFDTPVSAAAATPGIDADSIPESGELYTYTVAQTFTTGRQLRDSHLSRLTGGERFLEALKGE